jgi:hypothetical protein
MSISTYAEWRARHERINLVGTGSDLVPSNWKTSTAGTSSRMCSAWAVAGRSAGATPGASAEPNRALAGGLHQPNPINKLYIAGLKYGGQANTSITRLFFYDILNHSGGLNGTVTGVQTTNLPTAALSRYTSGEGVMAAIQIYTQIGATATTITVSYTNQAGTAGRISKAMVFGNTGNREAGVMIPIMLADGDTGVRSVENVNIVATTGTAGSFGIVLFRIKSVFLLPPLSVPLSLDSILGNGMQMEAIDTAGVCIGVGSSQLGGTPIFSFTPVLIDTA